ncbi:hypothetical protein Cantr_05730 [Candida viswanathii]|uniref:Mediator of RNA polymerase II transcription subunit 9 n=1 Tax=Candida viswanathii TaxID=5486 RepID=A0A367XRU0_9ASCO|nr:hypothetical protein Cantr_05730 [Candida viswanathii]
MRKTNRDNTNDIKTGTPIDLTVDSSIIQQHDQATHQVPYDNTAGDNATESSRIEPKEPSEVVLQLQEGQPDTQNKEDVVDISIAMQEDDEEDDDPIDKMRSMEVLPDLFNLLYELNNNSNTKVTAKDFDKYLGSLRLKLSNFKDSMQQIDNINETLVNTFDKIEKLKQNNYSKQSFLLQLKQKVDQSL